MRHYRYKATDPRHATESEIAKWISISPRDPGPPRNAEQLKAYLKKCSPRRWYRMERDKKWASRKLLQIGADPEDIRWLI